MEKKKILFLTTGNLAMKPRLVKEIRALKDVYEIHLLYFNVGNWTDDVNARLIKELAVFHYPITAGKSDFLVWFLGSIVNKLCIKLYPYFKNNLVITAFSSNKRSIQLQIGLIKMIKQLAHFDLVIGRNTATIFSLKFLKKRFKVNVAFDLEDYHPGERISWCNAEHEKQRRYLLLKKIIPELTYFSYASPLMYEALNEKILLNKVYSLYLPNSFFSKEFKFYPASLTEKKVSFVWFSVDVSANRGLELFIDELKFFKGKVELVLYGTKIDSFYNQYIKPNLDFITLKEPIDQEELFHDLSNYDVGLAIELNKTDFNRRLTLTNKIFAYAQAGLFVLATDTLAQTYFIQKNAQFGNIVEQNPEDVKKSIAAIISNIDQIRSLKLARFEEAKDISWDLIAERYAQTVSGLISAENAKYN